jgi:isopentenyl diphosphate isomerase/L-lactate dehydrogenase-like FMN-dependent dehydrogenase
MAGAGDIWSRVEMHRATRTARRWLQLHAWGSDGRCRQSQYGQPCRSPAPIASGGLRSGIDIAKTIA